MRFTAHMIYLMLEVLDTDIHLGYSVIILDAKQVRCFLKCVLSTNVVNETLDKVTSDVTVGQSKWSEQKIALQYACAPAGPVV